MQLCEKIILTALFTVILGVFPVHSDSLTYDIATGTLAGFDVNANDSPSTPGAFANGTEVWNTHSFVGRIVYTGPPTTLSFANSGPTATNTTYNRFYFTRILNTGQSDPGRWREFFLVLRAKGMRHSGAQHDFSMINTVVEHPGQAIAIPHGAGAEEVAAGQTGYNASGGQGVYDGSNGYKYLHPYRHVWVDVTLIRTSGRRRLNSGFYESEITVTAESGTSHILRLSGRYGWTWGDPPPFYSFGVTRTVDHPFPFDDLEGRTTPAQAMTVGRCAYSSEDCAATIRFAADPGGASDVFLFQGDGLSFRYYLAFDATKPDRAVEPISLASEFATESLTVYSPIDSSSHELHVLEGDIRMFLPVQVNPAEGIYSSTIYCFVTPVDR